MSQKVYIEKVLKHFQMYYCKPIDTPVAKGENLCQDMCPKTPDEIEKLSHVPNVSVVGNLMYAMLCT